MYGLLYQLKGCPRCMGDMVFDEGDWKCWQCGHYYYPRGASLEDLALAEQQENLRDPRSADNSVPSTQPACTSEENGTAKKRRRGYGARPEKNIDSLIQAKKTSEER